MKKHLKNTLMGISWGLTFNMIFLVIAVAINADFLKNISQYNFIKYAICSVIIGIGFHLPSVIYDKPNLSLPVKSIIHLGIGFVIYLIVAFYAGWIGAGYGAIATIIFIAISIVFTLLIYVCFYMYHKKEADIMNNKIKEIEKLNNN